MKPAANEKQLASEQRPVRQRNGVHRKLMRQIELLEMRALAAEDTWKQAKEQFSQARRRRKLAKLFAKRAKKDKKKAEANLGLARRALAEAKAQAMAKSWRAVVEKIGTAKAAVAHSKKQRIAKRRARKMPFATARRISQELAPFAAPASLPTIPSGETQPMA